MNYKEMSDKMNSLLNEVTFAKLENESRQIFEREKQIIIRECQPLRR